MARSSGYLWYARSERAGIRLNMPQCSLTKKGAVMATELKILNGPPFQKILSYASILSRDSITLTFTVQKPAGEPIEKAISIELLGSPRGLYDKEGEYCFAGCASGTLEDWFSSETYYYVGTYNINTRIGKCEMMTRKEFFDSRVVCLLFPKAAQRLQKLENKRNGSYRILKVALLYRIGNIKAMSMFLDIVNDHEATLQAEPGEADIIITDELTPELQAIAAKQAQFVLYGTGIAGGGTILSGKKFVSFSFTEHEGAKRELLELIGLLSQTKV
jgi:hypothetical protein